MTTLTVTAEPIEVTVTSDPVEVTITPAVSQIVVETVGVQGPPGPTGPPGSPSVEIPQTTPAATWTLTVPPAIGRTPAVSVYVDGAQVIADVIADSSTVTVTFPTPTAGLAVLT